MGLPCGKMVSRLSNSITERLMNFEDMAGDVNQILLRQ